MANLEQAFGGQWYKGGGAKRSNLFKIPGSLWQSLHINVFTCLNTTSSLWQTLRWVSQKSGKVVIIGWTTWSFRESPQFKKALYP